MVNNVPVREERHQNIFDLDDDLESARPSQPDPGPPQVCCYICNQAESMHEENFVSEAGQIDVKAIEKMDCQDEEQDDTDYEMDQFFMLFDEDGVSGELITCKNSIADAADFAKNEERSSIKISGMGVAELKKKKSATLISRKNFNAGDSGAFKED